MILGKEECEEPLSPQNGPILEAPPPQDNQDKKCKAAAPQTSVEGNCLIMRRYIMSESV